MRRAGGTESRTADEYLHGETLPEQQRRMALGVAS